MREMIYFTLQKLQNKIFQINSTKLNQYMINKNESIYIYVYIYIYQSIILFPCGSMLLMQTIWATSYIKYNNYRPVIKMTL